MKDLPYFKFIISEWTSGDITLCSMEAQGLFINLCAVYWSGNCTLSYTKAKRRYNGCNTTVWKELISEGIIKISGDEIKINFLDEQLSERKGLSEQNAQNVKKRWNKDTDVLPSNKSRNTKPYNKEEKREEKKREEERRTEKIGEGSVCVSIKSKYLNQNPIQIFDLEMYFESTAQLKQIQGAGWAARFDEFLKDNPARVFDDEDHLYNSFKKYCTEPKTVNGKPKFKPSFEL